MNGRILQGNNLKLLRDFPGGLLLDPFAGSGTTGCAAEMEGFRYVLMEQDPLDCQVAGARCRHWANIHYELTAQYTLFNT